MSLIRLLMSSITFFAPLLLCTKNWTHSYWSFIAFDHSKFVSHIFIKLFFFRMCTTTPILLKLPVFFTGRKRAEMNDYFVRYQFSRDYQQHKSKSKDLIIEISCIRKSIRYCWQSKFIIKTTNRSHWRCWNLSKYSIKWTEPTTHNIEPKAKHTQIIELKKKIASAMFIVWLINVLKFNLHTMLIMIILHFHCLQMQ